MKKIAFGLISVTIVAIGIFSVQFTHGWFVWYLLILPLLLRTVLLIVYGNFFGPNLRIKRLFNQLTVVVYVVILIVIIYAIKTVNFGNSWI